MDTFVSQCMAGRLKTRKSKLNNRSTHSTYGKQRLTNHRYSVMPHLTTIIHSRKIAVKRKHCKAKFKSPLKRIENRSMRSSGLKTHRPVKILHMAAIFAACIARNPSLSTVGSHFKYPVAILKTWRSAVFDRRKAKIGS